MAKASCLRPEQWPNAARPAGFRLGAPPLWTNGMLEGVGTAEHVRTLAKL
jgi:hypothetical protein